MQVQVCVKTTEEQELIGIAFRQCVGLYVVQ
jgi:hypothetical protein